MDNEKAVTVIPQEYVGVLMPALSIEQAIERRNQVVAYVKKAFVKEVDFGAIAGTDKPTLLKPGAEKLCSLFQLTPRFAVVASVVDWDGSTHGGEALFYYHYKCSLYRGPYLIAEGEGSCNSHEKKYRYRYADRVCPSCGQPTIKRSKFPPRDAPEMEPGWYCHTKAGGCGANFDADAPAIVEQKVGQVLNPDVAEQLNTIQKMGQKRALVAATLIAVNASEFFTQDLEDMTIEGTYEVKGVVSEKPTDPKEPASRGAGNAAKPAAATVTNGPAAAHPPRSAPISTNQRNKLIEMYGERFGGSDSEIQEGLDAIFESAFKHPLAGSTLAEASKIISQMIGEKVPAANNAHPKPVQSTQEATEAIFGNPLKNDGGSPAPLSQQPAATAPTAEPQRPWDLAGVRRALDRWEDKHAKDRQQTPEALQKFRGLICGKLDELLGGEEPRHILVYCVHATRGGSTADLSQLQLSAYYEWMALESRGENGQRVYLATPDTEVFKQEANAIITKYRESQGQTKIPL
jgi:hypothetical protein